MTLSKTRKYPKSRNDFADLPICIGKFIALTSLLSQAKSKKSASIIYQYEPESSCH